MPMDRSLYPSNWDEIALEIKQVANWICEECGRKCRQKGEDIDQFLSRIQTTRVSECPVVLEFLNHPKKWVLTVSHRNHIPEDCRKENLRALCVPCHCRYDLKAMATKKRLLKERKGQLNLLDISE